MSEPILVCASVSHGNTRRVADAIAGVLGASVISPESADPTGSDLDGHDLVGFGSGIYYGSFHSDLVAYIDALPPQDGTPAFLFATSGLAESRWLRFSASLVERLEHKGFEVVGGFSCRGFDTFMPFKLVGGIRRGRPNRTDLASARAFAEHLRDNAR